MQLKVLSHNHVLLTSPFSLRQSSILRTDLQTAIINCSLHYSSSPHIFISHLSDQHNLPDLQNHFKEPSVLLPFLCTLYALYCHRKRVCWQINAANVCCWVVIGAIQ